MIKKIIATILILFSLSAFTGCSASTSQSHNRYAVISYNDVKTMVNVSSLSISYTQATIHTDDNFYIVVDLSNVLITNDYETAIYFLNNA